MPAILRFRLVSTSEFKFRRDVKPFLFDFVLALLRLNDPDYAEKLREWAEKGKKYLPIRLVAPPGGFKRTEARDIELAKPFDLKVAILDETVFDRLLHAVGKEAQLQKGVVMEETSLKIILFNTDKLLKFEDFLHNNVEFSLVRFDLEMPILMEKLDFPTPEWIMDELMEGWLKYSDTELPAMVVPQNTLEIKDFNLRSVSVKLDTKVLQGIKGVMSFKIVFDDEALRETVWALSNFCEFLGIGLYSHLGYGTVSVSFQ